MSYFQWSNEFDVKVGKMNDQHKVLINIMNELYQLTDKGESKQLILNKLNDLVSYTRHHFRDEEMYMDAIQFEGRERHKIIHQHLLTELENHTEDFKSHRSSLSDDFFYFLKHWLTSHIKHIDIKYGHVSENLKLARAI